MTEAYTKRELRYIRALERRKEWLTGRYRFKKLSYDGEEIVALQWALDELAKARGPWKRPPEDVAPPTEPVVGYGHE